VFSPTAGYVHVCTRESFSGLGVESIAAGLQSELDAGLASWLALLKKTAEAT
jgi:hypothetical protein